MRTESRDQWYKDNACVSVAIHKMSVNLASAEKATGNLLHINWHADYLMVRLHHCILLYWRHFRLVSGSAVPREWNLIYMFLDAKQTLFQKNFFFHLGQQKIVFSSWLLGRVFCHKTMWSYLVCHYRHTVLLFEEYGFFYAKLYNGAACLIYPLKATFARNRHVLRVAGRFATWRFATLSLRDTDSSLPCF